MKKTLLLLLLFSASTLLAQKELSNSYSYSKSNPYKNFRADNKYYFSQENQSLAIKIDGKEIAIQKFDSGKSNLIKEKIYKKSLPSNYKLEEVLEVDNRYYILYSSWNGKDHKEQLFAAEVDFKNGELLDNHKLIVSIEGKVSGKQEFELFKEGWYEMIDGTKDKFDFSTSNDKKNLLVQYKKKPEIKNDKKSYAVIGLVGFDSSLNQISEKEIKMPHAERIIKTLDYRIDNASNIYMLCKVFHSDSYKSKTKQNKATDFHLELFFLKHGSEELKISKFDEKDKLITNLTFFDTDKDFSVLAGFYNNKKENVEEINGLVVYKINRNGEFYDNVFHEIPLDAINHYENGKTKTDKKENKNYTTKVEGLVIKNISVNNDSSLVIFSEQYYIHEYMYSSSGGMTTAHLHFYNDILATKLKPKGELDWTKKISKSQVAKSEKNNILSFYYSNANKNHYLFFLDNIKNIDLPLEDMPAIYGERPDVYLAAYKIADSNGEITKTAVMQPEIIKGFYLDTFIIKKMYKTDENSFQLETLNRENKKENFMMKFMIK